MPTKQTLPAGPELNRLWAQRHFVALADGRLSRSGRQVDWLLAEAAFRVNPPAAQHRVIHLQP